MLFAPRWKCRDPLLDRAARAEPDRRYFVVFEGRYSVRDVLGNPAAGRTRSEWDVVRRSEGLKIIRTNWTTYPDPVPPR